MKKLDVLLLGWEFPPLTESDSGIACYEMAKELAGQVNLSLILPKTDPEVVMNNVDLTGLNNVDLQATQAPEAKPAFSAFSEPVSVPEDIKLYGAPTYTGQEQLETPAYEQPGEAASVGDLGGKSDTGANASPIEDINIFEQPDLSKMDPNSQVIHYARYATRVASQKNFDVIYACDWMTYLAGVELKLISGKLLVVHVQSLSDDRGGLDSKGWIFEMEKQTLGKADFIITQNDELATIIETEYNIPANRIRSITKLDEPLLTEETGEDEEAAAEEKVAPKPEPITEVRVEGVTAASPETVDWQEAANHLVAVFQKLVEIPDSSR